MTEVYALLAVIAVQAILNGLLVWAVISMVRDQREATTEVVEIALEDRRARAQGINPPTIKKLRKALEKEYAHKMEEALNTGRRHQATEVIGDDSDSEEFVPAGRGAKFLLESDATSE